MSRSVRQTGPISIHTPLAGSDVHRHRHPNTLCYFNPHSPCGERLRNLETHRAKPHISIHTPLAGSDVIGVPLLVCGFNFNPHSPCGERPVCFERHHLGRSISIHTPLAGSDGTGRSRVWRRSYFNPHSPCGERLFCTRSMNGKNVFQSTLPLRGATTDRFGGLHARFISIHTPLAGSDTAANMMLAGMPDFNPHSPCGERRLAVAGHRTPVRISIHTPLAGSDRRSCRWPSMPGYFNPHSPCGERRSMMMTSSSRLRFQSTLPLRGATPQSLQSVARFLISIHTPLAGSDAPRAICPSTCPNFNPHSPCGERPEHYGRHRPIV